MMGSNEASPVPDRPSMRTRDMPSQVAIIGDGQMGLVLADALAEAGA